MAVLGQESKHLGPDRLRALCCYSCQSLSVARKVRAQEEEHLSVRQLQQCQRFFRYLPDFCHLTVEVVNCFVERPDSFLSTLPARG